MPADFPSPTRQHNLKTYLIPKDALATFNAPITPHPPLPTTFPTWHKAMHKTLTLSHATEAGLESYIRALSLDRHPDLTPTFKTHEIRGVTITIRTLTTTRIRVGRVIQEMERFLLDEGIDRHSTTQPQVCDYVMGWSEEVRDYVAKARAYLVSAHAFYKVNYALCPVETSRTKAQMKS